jgi:hypothetical protein
MSSYVDIRNYPDTHNNNEGLITKIWGPDTWNSLHAITFNYPKNPTELDKQHYKHYFELLVVVLPCCNCRESYRKHINDENNNLKLTYEVMESRYTLTHWLYRVHCAVNKETGYTYDISYEQLCNKYNSYIAICKPTNDMLKLAYKNYYNVESPTIQFNIAKCFISYAIERNLFDYENNINKTNQIDRNSDLWIERNNKVQQIIKKMRLSGNNGIEMEGKYKRFPTIEQLHLMELLSTILNEQTINKMIECLGYNFIDKYIFTKN